MKRLFFALALAILSITGANAQGSKIGHVNSAKVLDTIPSRKAAISEIRQIEAMGVKELRDMDSTLQAMYTEYQGHPEWTALMKQSFENRIRTYQGRSQEREQQIDTDLNAMYNDLNKKSLDMVKLAVNNVATLKKLNYVIDESVTLFTSGGTDITPDVVAEVLKLDAVKK